MRTTHQHHKFLMIGTCIADNQLMVMCKIDQLYIKDYHLLTQDDVNENSHDAGDDSDDDDFADDDDSDNDGQLCLLIN